jgi:acetyl-CoA synthetase
VVNVSGHRLSTAEIEAALIEHRKCISHLELFRVATDQCVFVAGVAEAAVVGVTDELTGQAVNAFVALKSVNLDVEQTRKELILQVRKSIGPFAAPKAVYVVDDLPKTRSGKIMRRILRKILSGEEDSLGDISTVSWPNLKTVIDIIPPV